MRAQDVGSSENQDRITSVWLMGLSPQALWPTTTWWCGFFPVSCPTRSSKIICFRGRLPYEVIASSEEKSGKHKGMMVWNCWRAGSDPQLTIVDWWTRSFLLQHTHHLFPSPKPPTKIGLLLIPADQIMQVIWWKSTSPRLLKSKNLTNDHPPPWSDLFVCDAWRRDQMGENEQEQNAGMW